jgi:hypothetical protein
MMPPGAASAPQSNALPISVSATTSGVEVAQFHAQAADRDVQEFCRAGAIAMAAGERVETMLAFHVRQRKAEPVQRHHATSERTQRQPRVRCSAQIVKIRLESAAQPLFRQSGH